MFTLGATTIRCQGVGTVTYDATATTTTGITYSLNAGSITGGNTINAATGEVTYAAGWSGSSTITVSAAGCNGPKTATHVITITPSVGTPVFSLGNASNRCVGAGNKAYAATATNNTGITYSLDAASLAGGNKIDAATGVVTYDAAWIGSSLITATASGCSGPATSSHTAVTNDLPVISAIAAQGTICNGSNTTVTASGANTYSWSPATGLSGTTGTTVTASPASTTTYTVTGTAATGCSNTTTIAISVNPKPVVSVIAGSATFCKD